MVEDLLYVAVDTSLLFSPRRTERPLRSLYHTHRFCLDLTERFGKLNGRRTYGTGLGADRRPYDGAFGSRTRLRPNPDVSVVAVAAVGAGIKCKFFGIGEANRTTPVLILGSSRCYIGRDGLPPNLK
jgi:hypothetical protein